MEIDVQYAIQDDSVPAQEDFRRWANAALEGRQDDPELTIRVVDQAESTSLNEKYRGKQGATNVLSFPSEAPLEIAGNLLGDLVICAPVVEEEAVAQEKNLDSHWAHMVIHGVLHLIGYDHSSAEAADAMESLEVEILANLDYPNPYDPNSGDPG
ncbi:MAG: rRNA maturation RNase YbeY [Gammaproteobacteria bacterium]|nr:MAG: rRNA maturation RNase YbeY [Gammaproteobacteria bacterium]